MRVNLDRIKVLADEKGWSQAELARKMHLSRAYISRLFSGERIGGKELLGGIMMAFPEHDLKEFILEKDVDWVLTRCTARYLKISRRFP